MPIEKNVDLVSIHTLDRLNSNVNKHELMGNHESKVRHVMLVIFWYACLYCHDTNNIVFYISLDNDVDVLVIWCKALLNRELVEGVDLIHKLLGTLLQQSFSYGVGFAKRE